MWSPAACMASTRSPSPPFSTKARLESTVVHPAVRSAESTGPVPTVGLSIAGTRPARQKASEDRDRRRRGGKQQPDPLPRREPRPQCALQHRAGERQLAIGERRALDVLEGDPIGAMLPARGEDCLRKRPEPVEGPKAIHFQSVIHPERPCGSHFRTVYVLRKRRMLKAASFNRVEGQLVSSGGRWTSPDPPTAAETRRADHQAAAPPSAAIEDRLDNLRRQQCQPQHPADIGCVHALSPSQLLKRGMHTSVQHLPPPERPRQRLDHGVVDPRPRSPLRSVRRHHQLPPAALPERKRDMAGDRLAVGRDRRPRTPPPSCCPPLPAPARRARSASTGPRRRASVGRPARPAAARSGFACCYSKDLSSPVSASCAALPWM